MPEPWNTVLITFGPTGFILIIALYTVIRGDWIPKKSHLEVVTIITDNCSKTVARLEEDKDKAEKRADEWQRIALRSLDVTEQTALVGKVLVGQK